MPRTNSPWCLRGHFRSTFGYRDKHGRSRCSKCDEMAKSGPLTKMKRRPRSFQNTWRWLGSQPVDVVNKLLNNLELKGVLSNKQVKVLKLRFGIDRGGSMRTIGEVGKIMGMTRPAAHYIEVEAYYKMTDEAARRRAEKTVNSEKWIYVP